MKPIQFIPQSAVDRLLAGDAEILFAAFGHGLTVDVRWPHWNYPLLHGLCHNCPKRVDEMVEAALQNQASSIEEHEGLSPLMLLIGGWHPDHDSESKNRRNALLVRLLDHVMDIDPTLLGAASAACYKDAVNHLLEAGCDPNFADSEGKTALHHSYLRKNVGISQLLISYGANENALDKNGLTPLRSIMGAGAQDEAEAMAFNMEAQTAPAPSKKKHDNRL